MDKLVIALCLIPCVSASIMMGIATTRAVDATGRQPEASGKISSILIMGLALTESTAIYGFVIALLVLFRS